MGALNHDPYSSVYETFRKSVLGYAVLLVLFIQLQSSKAQDVQFNLMIEDDTNPSINPCDPFDANDQMTVAQEVSSRLSAGLSGTVALTSQGMTPAGVECVMTFVWVGGSPDLFVVAESGAIFLEFTRENSFHIDRNDYILTLRQTYNMVTADIEGPCSFFNVNGTCQDGECKATNGIPFCNCDNGYCGLYCGGNEDINDDCDGEASGDGPRYGYCPADSVACAVSDCEDDEDCAENELCCDGCCSVAEDVRDTTLSTLPGGATYGILVITYDGVPYYICDEGWTEQDTKVACKQLGYVGDYAIGHALSFNFTNLPFFLANPGCFGTESDLAHCKHGGYTNVPDTCAPVAIECSDVKTDITYVPNFVGGAPADEDIIQDVMTAYTSQGITVTVDIQLASARKRRQTSSDETRTIVCTFPDQELAQINTEELANILSIANFWNLRSLEVPVNNVGYVEVNANNRCAYLNAIGYCYEGTCTTAGGTPRCRCRPGWMGPYCNRIIEDRTSVSLDFGTSFSCPWYSGLFIYHENENLGGTYMHQSGATYLQYITSDVRTCDWEVILNDGSERVLLKGSKEFDGTACRVTPKRILRWYDFDEDAFQAELTFTTAEVDPADNRLFPFGLPFGDDVVSKSSNGRLSSSCFPLKRRIAFLKNTYQRIHISENGFISWDVYRSTTSMTGNSGIINMIGAYVGRQDVGCIGQSVFYHEYDALDKDEDRSYDIFDRAQDLVDEHKSGNTPFTITSIFKVTWYRLRRPPCTYYTGGNCLSRESNVYQVVVVSDSNSWQSMVFVIYGPNAMNGGVLGVRLGYWQQDYYDSDGYESAVPSNYPRCDQVGGNTGVDGIWFFETSLPYRTECEKWHSTAQYTWARQTAACPCSEWQIWWNPFYTLATQNYLPAAYTDRTYHTCYARREFSIIIWVLSFWGRILLAIIFIDFNPSSYGREICCYRRVGIWAWNRPLINQIGPFAGSVIDPYAYNSGYTDKAAHSLCCGLFNYNHPQCQLFFDARPINQCYNYRRPFVIAIWFGDPHCDTLDQMPYTFNGHGEYQMLVSDDDAMSIQARMEPVTSEASGRTGQATYFTAFAIKTNSTQNITFAKSAQGSALEIHVGDAEASHSQFMNSEETEKQVGNGITLSKDEIGTKVNALFPGGWLMTVELLNGLLSLSPAVPTSYQGKVSGLLGNFDGNKSNDFQLPDGTILSADLTTKQIHDGFGEQWRVSESESHFRYAPGTEYSDFHNTSYEPLFEVKFANDAEKQAAYTDCNVANDEQAKEVPKFRCLFDLLVTGDASVATNTQTQSMDFANQNAILLNLAPELEMVEEQRVVVGGTIRITLNATDEDGDDLTFRQVSEPNDVGTLIDTVFTWQPTSTDAVNLQFVANDGTTDSAILSVPVNLSPDCVNGAPDFDAAEVVKYDSFKLATCDCDTGYEGETCEEDIDGCAEDPCHTFGDDVTCTDIEASQENTSGVTYDCSCVTGFMKEGGYCIDIDECNTTLSGYQADCEQSCSNNVGSYICECLEGFYLDSTNGYTCIDLDECSLNKDNCSQLCDNTQGGFTCECQTGYELQEDGSCNQTVACMRVCTEPAYCYDNMGTEECLCPSGYEYDDIQDQCIDVDECDDSSLCEQHCNNTDGSYNCYCDKGYSLNGDLSNCDPCSSLYWGYNCENACSCGPNVASCDSVTGCTDCNPGWQGYNCETDVDECQDTMVTCPDRSHCNNTHGSYICACETGFYMSNTTGECENINECENEIISDCEHNCTDTIGSYTCYCLPGFTPGENANNSNFCIDIEECELDECQHAHICYNFMGSFACDCWDGFDLSSNNTCGDINECEIENGGCSDYCNNTDGGYNCFCDPGYVTGFDLLTCIDFDECFHGTAMCTHNCTNTEGSYECSCLDGYVLLDDRETCVDVNECDLGTDNCEGTCDNNEGGFVCNCQTGLILAADGYSCEPEDTTLTCTPACSYQCVEIGGQPTCICPSNYQLGDDGATCEDINECLDLALNMCEFTDYCTNVEGSYTCDCPSGLDLNPDQRTCLGTTAAPPPTTTISIPVTSLYSRVVYPRATFTLPWNDAFEDPDSPLTQNIVDDLTAELTAKYQATVPAFVRVVIEDLQQSGLNTIVLHRVETSQALSLAEQQSIGESLSNDAINQVPFTIEDQVEYIVTNSPRLIVAAEDGTQYAVNPSNVCELFDTLDACLNGGSCAVSDGSPVCECASEYSGEFCEDDGSSLRRLIIIFSVMGGLAAIFLLTVCVLYARSRRVRRIRYDDDTDSDQVSTVPSRYNHGYNHRTLGYPKPIWGGGAFSSPLIVAPAAPPPAAMPAPSSKPTDSNERVFSWQENGRGGAFYQDSRRMFRSFW